MNQNIYEPQRELLLISALLGGVALLLLAVFIKSEPVYACSCIMPEPPQESLENSAAVFSGSVTSVTERGNEKSINLTTDTFWKGEAVSDVTLSTPRDSAGCGFNFEIGKTYLIYAHENEDGSLGTTLCSRTHEIVGTDDEDIAVLGAGTPVPVASESPTEKSPYAIVTLALLGVLALILGYKFAVRK